jgi:outer membrane protein OmpA-like peptidoglycan-associated protein
MNLSQRRAQAVSNRLVELGVPRERIEPAARGEEDPLVPTADGVREPQNRRIEIDLASGPKPGV